MSQFNKDFLVIGSDDVQTFQFLKQLALTKPVQAKNLNTRLT